MNKNPSCQECNSAEVVKSGKVKRKQRLKCKNCNFQFTRLTPRGRPATEKAMAVILYTLGLSMNIIAKIFNVSTPAVLKWIKNFAIANYEKPTPTDAIIIELDEMSHYLSLKKTNYGYGKLIAEKLANLSTGNAVAVTRKPF